MKRLPSTLLAAAFALVGVAAHGQGSPQPGIDWSPWLNNLTPRNVGPNSMGGRVTDLAVYEREPRIYYVATGSGGLFKTVNGGDTFQPVFQFEGTISLGAVGISQSNPDVVYVGTGEATSRNSVAWGDGVYKSSDGGKTWSRVGLELTGHIGKILVHPKNPDIVYVGALGRLWGRNPERGLFKSTDGGKTWSHILKIDANTGVIDMAMHPTKPDELLVAAWDRIRKPYDFISGGPGSGIYKTTDGGKRFRRISTGIPSGDLGRIGLDYNRKDPRLVVATIEYRPDPTKEPNRPRDAGVVKMFGGGLFVSKDGGESFTFTNPRNVRPFYFSLPKFDPVDTNRIYKPAVDLEVSDDQGKTLKLMPNRVHSDYHAFWINPANNQHIIAGTDGGIYTSQDRGLTWRFNNGMSIGQYYAVAVDNRRPYWIYGGLQDNSCWGTPTQTVDGRVKYFNSVLVGGGDGFYCAVDPDDWRTVYTESQGGAIVRTDLVTGASRFIRPRPSAGETLRFNWSTPYFISPHNGKTLYLGANKVFKSINRGDAWTAISPDLTTNDPNKLKVGVKSVTPEDTGAERHCTITTLTESPLKAGLLYAGTDDGQIQVTRDGGATWTNVTANVPGVPANTWVSRVLASKWSEGRVYVTFDGHRSDDFRPYVFVSEDYGATFTPLTAGLQDGDPVYVIREGERNRDLLYLGSELSLRISLDRGKNWTRFRSGGFPTVAVHDLVVHPTELDLVIGTHGRSLWTLDVSGLEQLSAANRDKDVALFQPQDVLMLGRINGSWFEGDITFGEANSQPGTRIMYHLKQPAKEVPTLTISRVDGTGETKIQGLTNVAGLNVITVNGRVDGRLAAGEYRVTLTVDGKTYTTTMRVVEAYLRQE